MITLKIFIELLENIRKILLYFQISFGVWKILVDYYLVSIELINRR